MQCASSEPAISGFVPEIIRTDTQSAVEDAWSKSCGPRAGISARPDATLLRRSQPDAEISDALPAATIALMPVMVMMPIMSPTRGYPDDALHSTDDAAGYSSSRAANDGADGTGRPMADSGTLGRASDDPLRLNGGGDGHDRDHSGDFQRHPDHGTLPWNRFR
jgi:hypothetical protein